MRQIVCLAAEPWSATPTRTQQLMSRMRDAEVLYFEPPAPRGSRDWKKPGRKLRPGLIAYILPPEVTQNAALPLLDRFGTGRTVRFLQAKLERHRFREPLLWCASPAGAQFLDELAYRGLVYDCYQDWPDFPERWESELALSADVCFAASPELCRHLAPCNGNVTLLPFGCNYPMFAKDDLPKPVPLRGIKGPILGFAGTLWHDLDLTPAINAAEAHPDCTLVLIGEDKGCRQLPQLLAYPNVLALGAVAPVDLPDYLAHFDVCLYLLRRGELQDDIIHARMFELLSAGRPIVAMLRPDQVEHFPDVVYGAHTPAEFALLCSRAMAETGTWARDRRREYGKAAAWSERAGEVNRILESIGLFG